MENWNNCLLKRILCGIQDGTHSSFERYDEGYPLLSAKNISDRGVTITDHESLIRLEDYQRIIANGYPAKGDICLCGVGSIGKCCLYECDIPYAFQRSVMFLRVKSGIDSKFIMYQLKSTYVKAQLERMQKKSAISGVYAGDVSRLRVFLPHFSEQQAIVSYLDDKCTKLDQLVSNKEKEIELLTEMKQRVIADAVTKGLNPDVKFKECDNICLPSVPEHWKVMRYGTLFKLKPVKTHHGEELLSVFLNLGVIRAADSDKRTHAASEDLSKYQLVEVGDFVMNNQQAWRGSVGVSQLVGIISPAYHIFPMPECYDPVYANYLLRSKAIVGQFEMSSRGVGSIQRTLNFNWLNNKIVPVPPIEEQKSIVAHIEEKVSKIDVLADKLQKEIEDIKEYKQRLISDVVTGQVKVC